MVDIVIVLYINLSESDYYVLGIYKSKYIATKAIFDYYGGSYNNDYLEEITDELNKTGSYNSSKETFLFINHTVVNTSKVHIGLYINNETGDYCVVSISNSIDSTIMDINAYLEERYKESYVQKAITDLSKYGYFSDGTETIITTEHYIM